MPEALFVEIPGATWQQHPSLPQGVARLKPVVQHFTLETGGKASVARKGFPVACDFSGTAHSFMGATLPACTLDLGFWDTTPNREAQLSGYMCLSRVKRSEDLCIVQPFSPTLFTNGELVGPHTLLEFHRHTLTLTQAKARFAKETTKRARNPDIMLYCHHCSPRGGDQPDVLLPLREFITAWDASHWLDILSQGMDRLCTRCRVATDAHASETEPLNPSTEDEPCAYCQTAAANVTGYCQKCIEKEPLACRYCDIGKKLNKRPALTDFYPEEVRRKKQTRELRRARCKKCVDKWKRGAGKARQGQCRLCEKTVSISHLHAYRSQSNTGVCRACFAKANPKAKPKTAPKTCVQCAQPLHVSAKPGSWCNACAYPPCDAKCGKARPQKGSYHAKNLPSWVCLTCRPKTCSQCRAGLSEKSGSDTLCHACAYPPCDTCGGPRPTAGHYHVAAMPTWTCANCLIKACCQCGASLSTQTHKDTFCTACAYPPCHGGCGAPRPSQSKHYHANTLPHWTCSACQARGLVAPGQKKRKALGASEHAQRTACPQKSTKR